jgi:hypothetical protein
MSGAARAAGLLVMVALLNACVDRTRRATTESPDHVYAVEFIHSSFGATVMPFTSVVVRKVSDASPIGHWKIDAAAEIDGDPSRSMRLQWVTNRTLLLEVESCESFERSPSPSPVALECRALP